MKNIEIEKELTGDNAMPPELVVVMTLWGEVRGEPLTCKTAVASVIRNRALRRHLATGYPLMTCFSDVCLQSDQFGCWKDRKFVKNLPVTDGRDDDDWDELLVMARYAMAPEFQTMTLSTHYHRFDDQTPNWVSKLEFVAKYRNHMFYLDPSWK